MASSQSQRPRRELLATNSGRTLAANGLTRGDPDRLWLPSFPDHAALFVEARALPLSCAVAISPRNSVDDQGTIVALERTLSLLKPDATERPNPGVLHRASGE